MVIEPIDFNSKLWDPVTEYADRCSWSAGRFLAKQMRERSFTDWEKVFVAREKGEIAGFCTLSKTDCIPGVDYVPYISFLFVGEPFRGRRLSEKLIFSALEYAKKLGFSKAFLVSGEQGLYEKYGFEKLEDRKDFWGREEQIFTIVI